VTCSTGLRTQMYHFGQTNDNWSTDIPKIELWSKFNTRGKFWDLMKGNED
jgi:hypothetical protein